MFEFLRYNGDMKINIPNFVISNKKAFIKRGMMLPVFEAVSNSVHAIQERRKSDLLFDEKIEITLIRDAVFEDVGIIPELNHIMIKDNGIGFHDSNLQSFETVHSAYKAKIGGKGFGRFSYLLAFRDVNIESIFRDQDGYKLRKIDFQISEEGVLSEPPVSTNSTEIGTTVFLKNFKKLEFPKNNLLHKSAKTMAQDIIWHFALGFLLEKMPVITIKDEAMDHFVNVNEEWLKHSKSNVEQIPLTISGRSFDIYTLSTSRPHVRTHEINLCAHGREVDSEPMNNYLGFIPKNRKIDSIEDDESRWGISVYVTGDYLDDNVSSTRDSFMFDSFGEGSFFEPDLKKSELYASVAQALSERMKKEFEKIRIQNYESCKRLIMERPIFSRLLTEKYRESLENIPSSMSDEKKMDIFRQLESEDRKALKNMLSYIRKTEGKNKDRKKYLEIAKKLAEQVSAENRYLLAEYVSQRKVLLEVLKSHLTYSKNAQDEAEKKSYEDALHELIMPMKSESGNILFEDHNLWVIDETLAFHQYIASDLSNSKISRLKSSSKSRMDLVIFQNMIVTSESKDVIDTPDSITIVEFKRPGRNDYADAGPEKNPHAQILKYVTEIKDEGFVDMGGVEVPAGIVSSIPITAYIIADFTPTLRKLAKGIGYIFDEANPQDGATYFIAPYNTYVEIIPYAKLLKRAERRNLAFFEKIDIENFNQKELRKTNLA